MSETHETHRTGMTEPSVGGRALMDLQQQLEAVRAERDAAVAERNALLAAKVELRRELTRVEANYAIARDDRDIWRAECRAAKDSRDAACAEKDAHMEAANAYETQVQQLEAVQEELRALVARVTAERDGLKAELTRMSGLLDERDEWLRVTVYGPECGQGKTIVELRAALARRLAALQPATEDGR